ncbi:hypothetical protein BSR29_00025 [Boudabousia liubingyangii]|uniref:Uncharacterized protein n=1 Tax=Boudabousia liubingyangii TaxID=1921764 RepID=A0A1Q5PP86_9ACTO|nr:hypothetical protein BSR29_00025 [Boudabousia liubingyangii]
MVELINFRTSVSGIRKTAIPVTLALVASIGVLGLPESVPVSQAFVPEKLEAAIPADQQVKVDTSAVLDLGAKEAAPGVQFTYKYRVAIPKLSADTSNRELKVTVDSDPLAPFATALSKSDLKCDGGTVSGFDVKTNTFTVTGFDKAAALNCSIEKTATLSADAPKGYTVSGLVDAKYTDNPGLKLQEISSGPRDPQLSCSPTLRFESEVKGGGYLVDIKMADQQGKGLVVPTPWEDPANSITIQEPGKPAEKIDLNGQYPVVLNKDSSQPYYGSTEGIQGVTKWLDSVNWKYDPAVFTGDKYLPAGTRIIVNRKVNYQNCVEPGIATDANTNRKMIINFTTGRPSLPVDSIASDAFRLPGGEEGQAPKAWCDAIYITDLKSSGAKSTPIYKLDPKNPMLSPGQVKPIPEESAYGVLNISPKFEGWVYYIASDKLTLKRFNLATGENVVVPVSGEWRTTRFALTPSAFSPSNELFITSGPGSALYKLSFNEDGSAATAKKMGIFLSQNPWMINDFTFDYDGGLIVTYGNAQERRMIVRKYSPEQFAAGAPRMSVDNGTPVADVPYPNGASSLVYGSAWGPDNTLYFTVGLTTTKTDREIYTLKDGKVTKLNYSPRVTGGVIDMSSCGFGGVPPKVESGFQARKLAIDPVTAKPVEGNATGKVILSANGTATVKYLIQVTNLGAEAAPMPADITDQVQAPAGFDITNIKVDGTSKGTGPTVKLPVPAEPIPAGKVKSFLVTVDLKAKNGLAGLPTQGVCENTTPGANNAGFFNRVNYQDDQDGTKNNQACIPFETPKRAHLKLVKQIEGPQGYTNADQDRQLFTLVAGAVNSPVTTVSGTADTGRVEVAADSEGVVYRLGEQQNAAPAGDYGFTMKRDWVCTGNSVPLRDGNLLTIKPGEDVSCSIVNQPDPKFSVKKEAANPAGENNQLGQPVQPDDQGKLKLEYLVKVHNDSAFAGNSGTIYDHFVVPAGLQWDGSEAAQVTVVNNGGGQVQSAATTVTKEQLAADPGAVLASSVNNLPGGATAVFKIVIPAQVDNTLVDGRTVFETHLNDLLCEKNTEEGSSANYFKGNRGAQNLVALEAENSTSNNGQPVKDNNACIPVLPKSNWKVEKSPADKNLEGGFGAAGGNGALVDAQKGADGTYTATVKYRVRVTNLGPTAGQHPQIVDALTLPEPWQATSVKWSTSVDMSQAVDNGKNLQFTIPQSEGMVSPIADQGKNVKNYVDYYVEVTAQGQPTAEQWQQAQTCETEGAGKPGKGFFNRVTMDGDQDGDHNNDACVPVRPESPAEVNLLVRKTDASGNLALPGAEFKVCDVNPYATSGDPVRVLADPNHCRPVQPMPAADQCASAPAGEPRQACEAMAAGDQALMKSTGSVKVRPDVPHWLVETKAPACSPDNSGGEYCASLLPQPLKFTVNADRVLDAPDAVAVGSGQACDPLSDQGCSSEAAFKQVDDTFYFYQGLVKVHDPRRGTLPVSGGTGPLPFAVAAAALLLTSLGWAFRNAKTAPVSSGRKRSRA